MKLISQKEYIKRPFKCISKECGSDCVEAGKIDVSETCDMALQDVKCLSCGLTWQDKFVLTGYIANKEEK